MLNPANCALVGYTCCLLHNFLIAKRPQSYLRVVSAQADPLSPTLEWQDAETLAKLQNLRGHTDRDTALLYRDHLRDYYCSPSGAVTWQDEAVTKHVSLNFLTDYNVFKIHQTTEPELKKSLELTSA